MSTSPRTSSTSPSTSLSTDASTTFTASSPMTDRRSVKVAPIRVTGTARREGCGPNATVLRTSTLGSSSTSPSPVKKFINGISSLFSKQPKPLTPKSKRSDGFEHIIDLTDINAKPPSNIFLGNEKNQFTITGIKKQGNPLDNNQNYIVTMRHNDNKHIYSGTITYDNLKLLKKDNSHVKQLKSWGGTTRKNRKHRLKKRKTIRN